jgi:hypothetical protein
MEHLIFDVTGSYDANVMKGFLGEATRIDLTDAEGVNLYCDDAARERLAGVIAEHERSGIRLLDSGNTHYLSALLAEGTSEDFALVLFDHHTDCKAAMFDMLSCGSWVRNLQKENPRCKQTILIGPPESAFRELEAFLAEREEALPEGTVCITEEDLLERGAEAVAEAAAQIRYPIYLSVDKDILTTDTVRTNWDQGKISLSLLLECLRALECGFRDKTFPRRLLALDICGLLPVREGAGPYEEEGYETDRSIAELFLH